MNRAKAVTLRKELLRQINVPGFAVAIWNATYSNNEVTFKVQLIKSNSSDTKTALKKLSRQNLLDSPYHYLAGKRFTYKGDEWEVTGYEPSRRKYKLRCTNLHTRLDRLFLIQSDVLRSCSE